MRRWSQRKLAAARKDETARRDDGGRGDDGGRTADALAAATPTGALTASPAANALSIDSSSASGVASAAAAPSVHSRDSSAGSPSLEVPLPSLESLTIESDFSPFMQSGVDEGVRRGALRKLFRDPRFNVMDGLDVYIDDYSKPSPIDPEVVRTLVQARHIFNPPKTRVNAQGYVEDVPVEELAAPDAGTDPVAQVADVTSDVAPSEAVCPSAAAAQAGSPPPDGPPDRDAGTPAAFAPSMVEPKSR